MSTRWSGVLRQLRWAHQPQAPRTPRGCRQSIAARRLFPTWETFQMPCRAGSSSGGSAGEGLLGQRRLREQQSGSSGRAGGKAPLKPDAVVREIIQNSKEVLNVLQKGNPSFKPVLAIVQAGEDNWMQEINQNLAEEAGLNITHICLPPDSNEDEIIDEILKLNEDPRIHGLTLQLSISSFSNKILNALKPDKDVDRVTQLGSVLGQI